MAKTNGKTNGSNGANHLPGNGDGGADQPDPPAKPKRKGHGKGGRTPGAINKVTRELKAMAQDYTEECLKRFVATMRSTKASYSDRMYAADRILDRGYGKPTKTVEHHRSPLDLTKLTDAQLVELDRLISAASAGDGQNRDPAPAGTRQEADNRTIN